jgi:hypothetical protein
VAKHLKGDILVVFQCAILSSYWKQKNCNNLTLTPELYLLTQVVIAAYPPPATREVLGQRKAASFKTEDVVVVRDSSPLRGVVQEYISVVV